MPYVFFTVVCPTGSDHETFSGLTQREGQPIILKKDISAVKRSGLKREDMRITLKTQKEAWCLGGT